jgi:hypothetical protein
LNPDLQKAIEAANVTPLTKQLISFLLYHAGLPTLPSATTILSTSLRQYGFARELPCFVTIGGNRRQFDMRLYRSTNPVLQSIRTSLNEESRTGIQVLLGGSGVGKTGTIFNLALPFIQCSNPSHYHYDDANIQNQQHHDNTNTNTSSSDIQMNDNNSSSAECRTHTGAWDVFRA